jgi:hypothetical protein
MSSMTNPMDALKSLQFELNRGFSLKSCELYPELKMTFDEPNGSHRFTYAKIESGVIKSFTTFIVVEPLEGKPCFSIGYATPKKFQGNGLASEVVEKSIKELKNGFQRNDIKEFYIEAVIAVDNVSSQKVANKTISNERKQIVDEVSGVNAYYYKRLVV